MGVIEEVAAERRRQVEAEGWTPEHDDTRSLSEMAKAASCYALWTTVDDDERLKICARFRGLGHGRGGSPATDAAT